MCGEGDRDREIYFKELTPVIVEAGKSKFYRSTYQAGDPGRS